MADNNNRNNILFVSIPVFIALFFIAGCSSVDRITAEKNAIQFVEKNVKFYTTEDKNLNVTDIPEYEFSIVSSQKQGRMWIVIVHISSVVSGEEKSRDLKLLVNSEGHVIEMNGQRVPGY